MKVFENRPSLDEVAVARKRYLDRWLWWCLWSCWSGAAVSACSDPANLGSCPDLPVAYELWNVLWTGPWMAPAWKPLLLLPNEIVEAIMIGAMQHCDAHQQDCLQLGVAEPQPDVLGIPVAHQYGYGWPPDV